MNKQCWICNSKAGWRTAVGREGVWDRLYGWRGNGRACVWAARAVAQAGPAWWGGGELGTVECGWVNVVGEISRRDFGVFIGKELMWNGIGMIHYQRSILWRSLLMLLMLMNMVVFMV